MEPNSRNHYRTGISLVLFFFPLWLAAQVSSEERDYSNAVSSIQLFPVATGPAAPAVVSLPKRERLICHFDDIAQEGDQYYYAIYHCMADWSRSPLQAQQYMESFNNQPIQKYELSVATRVSYVHYDFILPTLRLSGNYMLLVYRDYDENQPVFVRRFMVYEEGFTIRPDMSWAKSMANRNQAQQANLSLSYANANIINPGQNILLYIRQNHRFDQMRGSIPPLFVKTYENQLDYSYFDATTEFKGGFEFRRVDFRSTQFRGFNVAKIDLNGDPNVVKMDLGPDISTNKAVYVFWQDMNGISYPQKYETGNSTIDPDYIEVTFHFKVPQQEEDIYLIGSFNNWQKTPHYRMRFDSAKGLYVLTLRMKQGYYEYRYITSPNTNQKVDEGVFEGNYAQTENAYEFFAYYRQPGERYDRLMGYHYLRYRP